MSSLHWGMCVRPFLGQRVSGDAAVVRPSNDAFLFAIIDGLGHGSPAHEAALHAKRFLLDHDRPGDVSAGLVGLHHALKPTRGAAAGICFITPRTGVMEYAGIGNTVCRQFGKTERRFVSKDGTLGQLMPHPFVQQSALSQGDVIVMHTDGVRASVDARAYAGFIHAGPPAVARKIVEQFGKPTDDAGCLVIKYLG
ncbi:SpoIIE family protein phosphatase [Polyangium sp. 15x6]|uniref:SpoIIE family protein phosphatase n=1 Tax=Polyangium sp. 15x6 TaxID=3042687 RepID=UPI002499BDA3|nr:SpoIIE family protein phosphatase [Polyangium sp. 15x6]MDI3291227.1 SpoIIE family protein phosphatase [Polyangium sp. 15x6]